MNGQINVYVCGVYVTLWPGQGVVRLQYPKVALQNPENRNAFYKRLGDHCLVEEGVVGGSFSTITLNFATVEEAMSCLCEV